MSVFMTDSRTCSFRSHSFRDESFYSSTENCCMWLLRTRIVSVRVHDGLEHLSIPQSFISWLGLFSSSFCLVFSPPRLLSAVAVGMR